MQRWELYSSTRPRVLQGDSTTKSISTVKRARSNAFIEVLDEKFDNIELFNGRWRISDSEAGGLCSCRWSPQCIKLDESGLQLSIIQAESAGTFTSLVRRVVYGNFGLESGMLGSRVSLKTSFIKCGLYCASIRPALFPGVVTSFILCGDGEHEITAVEFVGSSPNVAQIGHCSPGHTLHYKVEILPREDGWYQVQVEWNERWIKWSINGLEIHSVNTGIPTTSLYPCFCLWSVNANYPPAVEWAGGFSGGNFPICAHISNFSVII